MTDERVADLSRYRAQCADACVECHNQTRFRCSCKLPVCMTCDAMGWHACPTCERCGVKVQGGAQICAVCAEGLMALNTFAAVARVERAIGGAR